MIRLLRGQVVIREDKSGQERSGRILTPYKNARETFQWHVGTVIAMGPPAFVDYSGRDVEVPHDFRVGDRVIYVWTHNEKEFTKAWPEDGLPVSWIEQAAVLAVVEP